MDRFQRKSGLLRRGASHRAPIRATGWLLALKAQQPDCLGCLKFEPGRRRFLSPHPVPDRRVNPAVTSFVYAPPTISPACRGPGIERVAYHVAFQDSGLGCSIGHCRRVRARRDGRRARIPASPSATPRSRSLRCPGTPTFTSVSPTIRPPRPCGCRSRRARRRPISSWSTMSTVRRRRPETGACEATAATLSVAVSASPSGSAPVIYLSTDGPADYRIFVRSKTFTARDAAALIVGAGDGHPRLTAASL